MHRFELSGFGTGGQWIAPVAKFVCSTGDFHTEVLRNCALIVVEQEVANATYVPMGILTQVFKSGSKVQKLVSNQTIWLYSKSLWVVWISHFVKNRFSLDWFSIKCCLDTISNSWLTKIHLPWTQNFGFYGKMSVPRFYRYPRSLNKPSYLCWKNNTSYLTYGHDDNEGKEEVSWRSPELSSLRSTPRRLPHLCPPVVTPIRLALPHSPVVRCCSCPSPLSRIDLSVGGGRRTVD